MNAPSHWRARRNADVAPGGQLELLEFKLANERYALETRHVVEVHPLRDLTPLPGTPPFVRGIVNLRGRILPVFDLKKFFGLPEQGVTDLHRIIVVRGNDLELGLLADVVASVRSVAVESLAPPLPTLSEIARRLPEGRERGAARGARPRSHPRRPEDRHRRRSR